MSATIDLCFNYICQQRKISMLFNVPPTRYNPTNPYIQFPQFTKMQFDMRRKAEVLQYNANQSNTKTNNLTKAQKAALILSGSGQNNSYPDIKLNQKVVDEKSNVTYETIIVKYPDSFIPVVDINLKTGIYDTSENMIRYIIVPNGRLCTSEPLIPKPTSASDVPGPLQYLYYDQAVPLYNYATKTNGYGIQNSPINPSLWQVYASNNISITSNSNALLFKLKILDSIDRYSYSFTVKTPIAFYAKGIAKYSSLNTVDDPLVYDISSSVTILPKDISVYYNNEIVPLISTPIVTFDANATRIGYNVNYDQSYSILVYLGTLTISNLYLYTSPGFIYEIHINCNINNNYSSILYPGYFPNTTTGIVCNLSENPTTPPLNATVYSSIVSTFTESGVSITGV